MLLFGGRVRVEIDSRWNSHVSVGKTVLTCRGNCHHWVCPGSMDRHGCNQPHRPSAA
jgi:hypothetical protein